MKDFFTNNKKLSILIIVQFVVLFILLLGSVGPRKNITLDGDKLNHKISTVSSGCYDVIIDYETNKKSIEKQFGTVELVSKANKPAINFEKVTLVGGKTQIKTKAWIAFGSRIKDLKFKVKTEKGKEVTIKQIVLKENLVWRVTRALGWMILCGLIDVFCVLVFGKSKYTLSLQKKYVFLALFAISAFASLPVFYKGLIKGDDLLFHLSRIASLTEGLKAGQFPLRIQSEMLNGYGYATPLFYCDFFLYIPAVLYGLCVPLQLAYKIYVVIVNVSTCVVTYYVFKKLVHHDKLAVVGSGIYVLGAYRIINIYRRAALGEYTAMIFFPLVIYGFYKVLSFEEEYKPKLKDYVSIIIGLSGVILSHVLSCEMVAGFILIICLVFIKKVFRKNTFWTLAKAAIATVILNLWTLIPFLQSMKMDLRVVKSGVNQIQQVGLSIADIFSVFYVGHASMERKVKVISIGIVLVIGMAAYVYYRIKYEKQDGKLARLGETTALLGIFAILLSTRYIPWDSIQAYSWKVAKVVCTIQFPWRFLVIATVMFTFATVIGLAMLVEKKEYAVVNGVIGLIATLAIITTGYFYLDNRLQSATFVKNTFEDVGTDNIGRREYLPVETDKKLLYVQKVKAGKDVSYTEYRQHKGITNISCTNKSDKQSSITIPLLKYDHYRAVDLDTREELKISKGENGLVKIELPKKYSGNIEVRYVSPVLWKIAILISTIAWAGVIVLLWRTNWEGKKA